MDYYDLLEQRGHVVIPAGSDPTDTALVDMVRRMRENGWEENAIEAFFAENPVRNIDTIMERAGAPA